MNFIFQNKKEPNIKYLLLDTSDFLRLIWSIFFIFGLFLFSGTSFRYSSSLELYNNIKYCTRKSYPQPYFFRENHLFKKFSGFPGKKPTDSLWLGR